MLNDSGLVLNLAKQSAVSKEGRPEERAGEETSITSYFQGILAIHGFPPCFVSTGSDFIQKEKAPSVFGLEREECVCTSRRSNHNR